MQHEIGQEDFFNIVARNVDCYGAFNTGEMLKDLRAAGYMVAKVKEPLKPQNDKVPPTPDYVL